MRVSADRLADYMKHWDQRSRRAVQEQLGGRFHREHLAHFSEGEATLLRALLARMVPQPEGEEVDLAEFLDWALERPARQGRAPAKEVIRTGLVGVQEMSLSEYGRGFVELEGEEQDAVLSALQEGMVTGGVWGALQPQEFLSQLVLRTLAGYCAHPFSSLRRGGPGANCPESHLWMSHQKGPLRRRVQE